MANDKDFIVKNGVEVGKNLDINSGTISSGAVDLSTGNFFADTLTGDKTYSFTNPSDVQSFQLEVTGGASGFDLDNLEDTGQTFTFSSGVGGPLVYNNDGTKFYMVDWSQGPVYEYTLSTAYDVSTATLNYTMTPTAYSGRAYRSLAMSRSGTRLYLLDDNSTTGNTVIRQFNLSTGYDLSTASTAQDSSFSSTVTAAPYGMAVDEAGTNFYVISNARAIIRFTLGSTQDVSSLSQTSNTTYSDLTATPRQMALSSDGTALLITGQNDQLDSLVFDTAYVSTSGTVTTSSLIDVGLPDGNYYGLAAKPDLSLATVFNTVTDSLYTLTLPGTASVTWPTNIDWNGGTTPQSSPDIGKTDIYSFVTPDGGTTYYGYKPGSNLS